MQFQITKYTNTRFHANWFSCYGEIRTETYKLKKKPFVLNTYLLRLMFGLAYYLPL